MVVRKDGHLQWCTACTRVYARGGHVQCKVEPWAQLTQTQRDVCDWLRTTGVTECPKFAHFQTPQKQLETEES